jgi:hypothetical protein
VAYLKPTDWLQPLLDHGSIVSNQAQFVGDEGNWAYKSLSPLHSCAKPFLFNFHEGERSATYVLIQYCPLIMSYIVQVPSTYLTLRFVQLGLTFVTLAVDIASIVLLSQYEVVNYGPTAWGIWTVRYNLTIA